MHNYTIIRITSMSVNCVNNNLITWYSAVSSCIHTKYVSVLTILAVIIIAFSCPLTVALQQLTTHTLRCSTF